MINLISYNLTLRIVLKIFWRWTSAKWPKKVTPTAADRLMGLKHKCMSLVQENISWIHSSQNDPLLAWMCLCLLAWAILICCEWHLSYSVNVIGKLCIADCCFDNVTYHQMKIDGRACKELCSCVDKLLLEEDIQVQELLRSTTIKSLGWQI